CGDGCVDRRWCELAIWNLELEFAMRNRFPNPGSSGITDMKRHYLASLALCGVVAFASNAGAQTLGWGNNGYVSINGLYQSTPITFTTTARPEINQEPGEV